MRRSTWTAVPIVLALFAFGERAGASPTARRSFDVYGDAIVIGSTLGWDCGSGLTPPAGSTVDCTGETATTAADKAPDIYWQDNTANKLVLSTSARTSATLTLPSGATVVGARLYWGALLDGTTLTPPAPDTSVLFGKAGSDTTVTTTSSQCASLDSTGPLPAPAKYIAYQCSADVTSMVTSSGEYRVSDVSGTLLNGEVAPNAFSGWMLVVVVSSGTTYRHVTLFDGLDFFDGSGSTSASISPSGFRFASGGAAELTPWGYAGGAEITGDFVKVGATALSNALNPANDFFDQTTSRNGVALPGTTPALSGAPHSMAGIDIDGVDVASLLSAGATTYTASAGSSGDTYFLGGFVASTQSGAPLLNVTKTFTDLDGSKVVPGDTLQFTITASNAGDDDAVSVVLRDALPSTLSFVAGSIAIDGASKTDAAGDDQAEIAGTTVTARVGTGATASSGGTIAAGASTTVTFRATVTASPGTTSNQAFVNAAGSLGAPAMDSPSDGDPSTPGAQATSIVVVQCQGTRGCSAGQVCNDTTNTCGDAPDAGGDTGGGTDGGTDGAVSDTGVPSDTATGDTSSGDTGSTSDDTGSTSADSGTSSGDTGSSSGDSTASGDSSTSKDSGSTTNDTGGGGGDTSFGNDASQDGSVVGAPTDTGITPDSALITEGSGCACTTAGGSGDGEAAGVAAAFALAMVLGRRRRR